jgi:hypothetical protein
MAQAGVEHEVAPFRAMVNYVVARIEEPVHFGGEWWIATGGAERQQSTL